MDELIKREDAIEAMYELQGRAQSKTELTGISKAWKRIKVLPTVDAVPVVRCGKCKHWNRFTRVFKDERKGLCEYSGHIMLSQEDFFCADGERRSDE